MPAREKTTKLILLAVGCVTLFVAVTLVTRQPQVGLFIAVAVQMLGVFAIAPWRPR